MPSDALKHQNTVIARAISDTLCQYYTAPTDCLQGIFELSHQRKMPHGLSSCSTAWES